MSKIAVIGGGMAGLATARILKDAGHEVCVFEALQGKGMDSHSLEVDGGIIDSPLRVMNPIIWKNTLALARYVGIKMFRVNTYMSCNWLEQQDHQYVRTSTWLTTARAKFRKIPLLADWQLGKAQLPTLLQGWLQFQYASQQFFKLPDDIRATLTLAQFINRYQIHPTFWHGCMMPVLYTLCTCDEKVLGDWLAEPLIDFLHKMQKGSPLLRMYGGTHGFVEALSAGIQFYSDAKVTKVHCHPKGVIVQNSVGIEVDVDHVVVATPTHVIDFLDEQQFAQELHLLRQYQFTQGELVIHQDENCMPKQRKHWSAISYCMDQTFGQQMFSVWLNAVEPSLVGKQDVFQTWNPTIHIDPAKVLDRVTLTRAIVDQNTIKNTKTLMQLQSQQPRQVYFCGSWLCEGLPILESAVTSAMFVAQQLGASIPFEGLTPQIIPAVELAHAMAS